MNHRGRAGFTLIELLIVVVILGILAAIAIPKFSSSREKAFRSGMVSDLKHVATAQEFYHSSNFAYASALTDLGVPLTDAVFVSINEATVSGWAATATHAGLASGAQCGVYFGDASASNGSPAAVPGVVTCTF